MPCDQQTLHMKPILLCSCFSIVLLLLSIKLFDFTQLMDILCHHNVMMDVLHIHNEFWCTYFNAFNDLCRRSMVWYIDPTLFFIWEKYLLLHTITKSIFSVFYSITEKMCNCAWVCISIFKKNIVDAVIAVFKMEFVDRLMRE